MAIDQDGRTLSAFEENLVIDDARPSRRFRHVVDHSYYNNVHAGLFRSESLRKTMLEQPYPAADMVMIAELVLWAVLRGAPSAVLPARVRRARRQNCDSIARTWSFALPEIPMLCRYWPTWRSFFGYFQAVLRSPIETSEKVRICRYLLRRSVSYRRMLWNELCRATCVADRSDCGASHRATSVVGAARGEVLEFGSRSQSSWQTNGPGRRFVACAVPVLRGLLRETFVDLGMSPLCESYLSRSSSTRWSPFFRCTPMSAGSVSWCSSKPT